MKLARALQFPGSMRASTLLLGLMVASCSHLEKQGETAEEHREKATLHFENAGTPWDPGSQNMEEADRELIEANAHLAAARSLESFADQACVGLSVGERSSCPLFASRVRRVEWASEGFTIRFKQASDAAQTYPRLRCHLAYALSTGFDKPSCPLFIPGTSLRQEGSDGITFAGDSSELASALRVQARRVFLASQVTQHRSN